MFEEVNGLPAHPLMVHAAVVFVPLLALAAVAYAFVPWVRPHTRWVLGLLAIAAPASALMAKLSGDAFLAALSREGVVSGGFVATLHAHRDLGNYTLYAAAVLALLAAALVTLVKPHPSATPARGRVLSLALGAVTVLVAGAAIYYVVRTGDSGATAVWGSA